MATPNEAPREILSARLSTTFTDRPLARLEGAVESWRVRFCVMPYGVMRRAGAGERETRASCAGAVNLNAAPLARRLEALRRVLENPKPALARLARLLAARREAVAAAFRPYRPPATPVRLLLGEAQHEVELALNTT